MVPEISTAKDNFFVILGYFLPFYSPNSPKNKNCKKMKKKQQKTKKRLGISSFYTSVPKLMIIYYTVPEIWCVTDIIILFHFGLFNSPKNKNFKKKKAWRYHFTLMYQKS